MPLIELKNINKSYFNDDVETPALRGVSFSINSGEFVAIMGPSGSGKSTLLHILGFLDRQTSGEYFFDNKTIDDYSKEEVAHVRNKKMGFIFQTFNLLPRTSVLENVKLPLLYSGIKEHYWDPMALKAIEMVDLSHRAYYLSSQISGGEQQRVLIARALACEPKMLLLDEPMASVDPAMQTEFYELLERLRQKMTIIMVSHDISAVSIYVEKIACLNRQLFYHGSKEIGAEVLQAAYQCPIEMIAHGAVPHRVLKEH